MLTAVKSKQKTDKMVTELTKRWWGGTDHRGRCLNAMCDNKRDMAAAYDKKEAGF